MTRCHKAICILFALGFLLHLNGLMAFEVDQPILGMILGGSGILSFLSILWILWREDRKEQEERLRWYK